MKIALLSDTHGYLPPMPNVDLIVHAGDLCPNFGDPRQEVMRQAAWLNKEWRGWLEENAPVVATMGNHDFIGQRSEFIPGLPWTLLLDGAAETMGLRIYGTPWSVRFMDWAFMASEAKLDGIFSKIPEGLDILLVHTPPKAMGNLDFVNGGLWVDNLGSESLAKHLRRAKPKHVVFGHIHEARGEAEVEGMMLHNVSYLDGGDQPWPLAIPIIEL